MKKYLKWMAVATAAMLVFPFAACSNDTNGTTGGGGNPSQSENENPGENETPSARDFKIVTDIEDGYTSETVSGEVVYTFTKGGVYTVSGDLTGRLVFAEQIDTSVELHLAGCTITSAQTAVYWMKDGGKIEIKADSETENAITTTADSESSYNTIDSENNIELGGSGTLNITGGQKHAVSGSNIEVKGTVTLGITAKSDGLHGKQITVKGGTTAISGCADAVQAELNSKGSKGTFTMTGGALTVSGCKTAVKYDSSVTVEAGVFTITECNKTFKFNLEEGEESVTVADGTVTVDGEAYSQE